MRRFLHCFCLFEEFVRFCHSGLSGGFVGFILGDKRTGLLDGITDGDRLQLCPVEGLADVDAGRVMDHETVRVWADNLPISHLPPI